METKTVKTAYLEIDALDKNVIKILEEIGADSVPTQHREDCYAHLFKVSSLKEDVEDYIEDIKDMVDYDFKTKALKEIQKMLNKLDDCEFLILGNSKQGEK